jgi:hypothetical protein
MPDAFIRSRRWARMSCNINLSLNVFILFTPFV